MTKEEEELDLSQPIDRIKFMWQWLSDRSPITESFDSVLKNHLKPLSATPNPKDPTTGTAAFSLTVPASLCNSGGNLHGGAVALIFDLCTSMAVSVCAREGFWDSGHVSRTLNCTYLRPAPEGTELIIECSVVSLGKTMAELSGTMRRRDDGKLCYTCSHGKVAVDFGKMRVQGESRREGKGSKI